MVGRLFQRLVGFLAKNVQLVSMGELVDLALRPDLQELLSAVVFVEVTLLLLLIV